MLGVEILIAAGTLATSGGFFYLAADAAKRAEAACKRAGDLVIAAGCEADRAAARSAEARAVLEARRAKKAMV